jgi:hypothetical protein
VTSSDIQLAPHQRLTVVESSPERLVVESAWDADADEPLRHYHPTQVATRARWTITPALGTEAMFRGLGAASSGGRVAQLRVLAGHRDEMRLASPPDAVQRVLLAIVRLIPGGPRNS